MTAWEQRIIDAFVSRYPASAAARAGEGAEHRPLRIQAKRIFADFNKAPPDEKESFLEAAESLEAQHILSVIWERRREHELISAFVCGDPERLFAFAGAASPKIIAEKAREAARIAAESANPSDKLFAFLAENTGAPDAVRGINAQAIRGLALLCSVIQGMSGGITGITARALSVSLYRDSKRLESLLDLFGSVFIRARRQGVVFPDFSFLDRSFPETLIAGKIMIDIPGAPLINSSGSILGLPLVTILKIQKIKTLLGTEAETNPATPSVLSIENKETFYAMAGSRAGASPPDYDCLVYAGGHPNRAVSALVSVLAESGFDFYHAGDLDPDGILIMQELSAIARKSVTPVGMDPQVFDRYLYCGRRLEKSMLRRAALIHETTRSIPGIQELINRIEETGMGIEQEIIDYGNKEV